MQILNMRRWWPWVGVAVLTTAGSFFHDSLRTRTVNAQENGQARPSPEAMARIEAISDAFKAVARQVRPAVVQISSRAMRAETAAPSPRGINPEEIPGPLREFFKEFEGNIPTPPPQPRVGSGSGFIIDAERGLIVTNSHVIGEATEDDNVDLRVKLPDGRFNIKATVVGRDPNTDIAVIKIEAGNLKAIPLGNSEQMEVGDWVLAIGAPFGLEQTVTQGIVSAKGRSGFSEIPYQDWLQTDAAINPGNSGGPLVNMRGEVIGVNVAIATTGLAGGYQGVGFAIPVNTLKEVLPYLREGREVVRGYLGVSIQGLEVQPGLAETFGLEPDARGVLIEDVQTGTPAAKAGLRSQDIILAYNGVSLESASHLQGLVARTRPDTTVNMKVWREAKEITIPVTIEKQPRDFFARSRTSRGTRPGPGDEGGGAEETIESLGMTVQRLTPELATRYGIEDDNRNQVVVTEVKPLGEAALRALSPGDIIVSIQDEAIRSPGDLVDALNDEALERGVRMRVRTRSGYRTLFLKLPVPGE